jgi:ABC-2 type transport system permease protein
MTPETLITGAYSNLRISFAWSLFDLKMRYRRTKVGAFWETINISLLICSIGLVSSALFNRDFSEIVGPLSIGLIIWSALSSSINQGCSTFITNSNFIKNSPVNITILIGRTLFAIYLTFLHQIVICLPLYFFGVLNLTYATLFVVPGIIIFAVNSFWVIGLFGFICSRYRDLRMVIENLTRLLFFLTPVFWSPEFLPAHKRFIIDFNPFYYFIELVRSPLLGKMPELRVCTAVLAITVVGFAAYSYVKRKFQRDLAFHV